MKRKVASSATELEVLRSVKRQRSLGDSVAGRGLRSSTFRLNVSTLRGIRWVHDFPPVY